MTEAIENLEQKSRRPRWLLILLLVLGALILGGIIAYYWYEGLNYVQSQDANIEGNLVYVYPPASGRLDTWTAHIGETVRRGETIGTETVDNMAGGQSVSPQPSALGATITAPISGVVVDSTAVPGSFVSPQEGALALLADNRNLWVIANIQETEIAPVKVGDLVEVTVDAHPGKVYLGQVEAIEQASEASESLIPDLSTGGTFTKVTQRIPVKIRLFDIRHQGLMIGMDAEVKILLNHHDPLYRQVLGGGERRTAR